MISKKIKHCRICLSKKLYTYIDLGIQPPSNSFIQKRVEKEKKFPLRVKLCLDCALSQLDTVVSHKFIFSDYMYLSSSSKALVNHYKKMILKIKKEYELKKKDLILDIGCNDGIILDCYGKNYTNLKGVEPSSAGKYARKKGHKIIKDFFSYKLSNKIKKKYGYAKLITATNVFAHVDDIRNFTHGISKLLSRKDGIFVIEFPYLLDMLENLYFDTIYHEHLSYLSITPLIKLFEKHNLRIFNIEKTNVGASGPALRVFVCKNEAKYKSRKIVKNIILKEKKKGVKSKKLYKIFSTKVEKIKTEINNIIDNLLSKGFRIGAFGAPAKGNTLLNYLKLNISD